MRWESKVPTVHRWQNATQVHDFDRYVGSEIRGLTAPKAAPKDGCELTKKHGGEKHGHGELIEFMHQLDDGWPESEKHVLQAALSMVVVKNSRWMVGEFDMIYGGESCEITHRRFYT